MGVFHYGASRSVELDDRLLAHLEVVIVTKLRRNESFVVTFATALADGSGRRTFWLHPAIELEFQFFGSRPPALNRAWLEALTATANSGTGLHVVPEPEVP